jgi:hypothetical protein
MGLGVGGHTRAPREGSLLCLKTKKQKNFIHLSGAVEAGGGPYESKSFFASFCSQKEGLTFLP